jgi:hypothetical protein
MEKRECALLLASKQSVCTEPEQVLSQVYCGTLYHLLLTAVYLSTMSVTHSI